MGVNTDLEIQSSNETGFQPFEAVMTDPFFSEETACCQESFNEMYNIMVERLFPTFLGKATMRVFGGCYLTPQELLKDSILSIVKR